jgi:hypothetical protein
MPRTCIPGTRARRGRLTELIPEFSAGPVAALRAAIAAESQSDFAAGYGSLTQGCNGCHVETNFSFTVGTRPAANPYTNQKFERPH